MESWANLEDYELVTLAQHGRPDAYGELVRRYQAAVYNTVYRLVGERQQALDLAQEALVRAYNALDSFDQARPFGPWISRIATNLALNWLQRRRVATVPLVPHRFGEDEQATRWLADYTAEPERVYLNSEQHELLRRAILALPPRYRAIVELRHFHDLSYSEIAATLGIPLSDVKSCLFRARRLLREGLEGNQ